ncbi:MAG TPA: acyltransferase [Conexibacter sp.]|nr:acyltransferase [Conexibacter sp.]
MSIRRRRAWSDRLSRRRELLARLRGQQTLQRARAAGLDAPGPLHVGSGVSFDHGFAWAISIGAHTRIAHDVRIIAHDAAMKTLTGYTEVARVTIGADCYLGAGTIVLPGSRIGDAAVIGAGSIVRGEIPAGAIAVGAPASVVGDVEELRARHERLQGTLARFDQLPANEQARAAMRAALDEHGRIYVP